MALTLVGVTLVCFVLIRSIPGDPVLVLVGERGASPEAIIDMKQKLGLDKSLPEQFWLFATRAVSGDLGKSIVSKNEVLSEFKERFPATLELGFFALLLAVVIAIPLGIVAAIKRNTWFDHVLMGASLVGFSMPIFWWGLILILIFSVNLGWTPVSGRIAVEFDVPTWSGLYLLDTLRPSVLSSDGLAPFISSVRHLILPAIALGTIPLAVLARMTRSSMLEVLGEDYVRTARAKGLSFYRIIFVHALKNALIPIVTTVALLFGLIITGAVLTESIFSWPGVGKWIVASIVARDYPVIQGGVLILSSIIIITNVLVDLIYILINPRLRKSLQRSK